MLEMKPLFEKRMRKLLPEDWDFKKFLDIIHIPPRNFIRCNTLKISSEDLIRKLSEKWTAKQLFPSHPEIILISSELKPGELGNSLEHILGYYYIQEASSMMSAIALSPKKNELVLDLFASPGSKTTQIAAQMENSGAIIANDLKIKRIKILSSNLERCGVTNCIVTKNDAVALCAKLSKTNFRFDKILVDAPCSGEGTLRSSSKIFSQWNYKIVGKLSRQQKKFIAFALKCLKKNGTLVYSTCTHAPEENEEVIDFAVKNFPVKVESFNLPIKAREGILEWENKKFDPAIRKCKRIYPQDNDTEGFFIAKLTLKDEIK